MSTEPIRIDTDLLVVGGGVAGTLAALAGREAGLDVTICDKAGFIERAGSVGGGVDHFLTVMETGPDWDTPEFLLRHVPELTDGIVDLEVTGRVIRETPRMLRRLESMGVDFRDPDSGTYFRHRSFGMPATFHINFDGKRFKHVISRAARRGGVHILPRTLVARLLVTGGRACGVVALQFRRGEWYVVRARAVVVATGDVNRLSRNASGLPYDSWHCPYNTGDGHAMAFRAGAWLTNMEFVEATLTPKGFSTQGLNALCGMGAYFLNRLGERFMFKYDARGEKARRSTLVDAVINEVIDGNGPIYLDLRHLPGEELDRIERTMEVDRHTLPGFYRQKGVDFRRDVIEVSVSELSIRRSGLYFRGSGLVVDSDGRTPVAGLFAAGDCSTVSGGISGAATLGYIAGQAAASECSTRAALPEIPAEEIEQARASLFGPIERSEGRSPRAFEDRVREVVTDHVGYRRTDRGLRRGLQTLLQLADEEDRLRAGDLHELMRVHEARSVRQAAELMARAALVRQESRTGSAHVRLDHRERDDVNWRKFIVLHRESDGVAVRAVPADLPLAAAIRGGGGR